jgi:hypothetical protein
MKSKPAVTNSKAAKPIPAPIPAFALVLRPVPVPDEDVLASRSAPVLRPVPVPDEDVLASRSAPVLRPVPDGDTLAARDVVVEVDGAAESVEGVLLDEALLEERSFDEVEGKDAGPGMDVDTLVVVARASI